jgi:hypothetical protein
MVQLRVHSPGRSVTVHGLRMNCTVKMYHL